jgi:hypothetical protein
VNAAVDRLAFICSMKAWQRAPVLAHDEALAFDRASVRTFDADRRLHVALIPITKACISDYVAQEIPGWEELGLDPSRIYKLLRDPDELRKAVPTFNNLPILASHVPVDAANYAPDLVVGSTGTDAVFDDPYLKNTMVIWAQPAIDEIESGAKKSLSCGYRYVPVMEPGNYRGQSFEGRMTQIGANHLALVNDPRVNGMVIGDSKENLKMAARERAQAQDAQVRRDAIEKARRYNQAWPESCAGWRPPAGKRKADV